VVTVGATGAQGQADPVAAGTATLTATVEGQAATMTLEVKAAPTTFAEFKALYPHSAPGAGGFVVASEVTPAYSSAQLEHLLKSWDFFTGFFPKTPGSHTEMYYSWDPKLLEYAKATFAECDSALAPLPGRLLLTCSESGNVSWIIAPYLGSDGRVPADHASPLASVSQSFMDSITTAQTYAWPWLWEGLSFALKSGDFDGGAYAMRALNDPERTAFKQALAAGTLLPLTDPAALDLVELTRTRTVPVSGTWFDQEQLGQAQSSVLLNYLFINYQPVLKNLFAAIDAGTVTTSEEAFAFVLAGTGRTAEQLEADYRGYGASL